MAFSSFGSIHSILRQKPNKKIGFSGSVSLLYMNASSTATISAAWHSVNGTGSKLIAVSYGTTPFSGGVNYISTDGGNTWASSSSPTTNNNFRQAAISYDGVHVLYCINNSSATGTIYTGANCSNNSGSTYGLTQLAACQGAFLSDDGNVKIIAINNFGFYRIYNSPTTNTFSTSISYATALGSIKGSSNGQYLLINSGLGTLFSNNYGASWSSLAGVSGITGSTTSNMGIGAVSGNGQYILVHGTGYLVWLSTNYGSTWTTISGLRGLPNTSIYTSTTTSWGCAAINYSGQYMTICGYFNQTGGPYSTGGYVFISSNYGSTWTAKTIPLVTASSDPAFQLSTITYDSNKTPIKLFITSYAQGIYVCNY
jgi:hypothetical protein